MNRESKKKIKKQSTFYALLGKIADIILYPVLALSLFSSVFMYAAKSKNLVPPVFGYSIVRVLSGSMINSGFNVNDMVFVKQTNLDKLKLGDVIAFYYFKDTADTRALQVVERYNYTFGLEVDYSDENIVKGVDPSTIEKVKLDNRLTKSEVAGKDADVYFHQIIGIYVDDTGKLFYETKGTSNKSKDSIITRADFVVGKYVGTPKFLRSAITFCSTGTGMLILVVFPLSILCLLQLLSIFEQIGNIMLEKKVLQRKERYDCPESIKANICMEMRNFDKAYFYDVMPEKEKPVLYSMLWGYMDGAKLRKRDLKCFNTAKKSIEVYDYNDSEPYWAIWLGSVKTRLGKKQFKKAHESALKEISFRKLKVEIYNDINKEKINEKK